MAQVQIESRKRGPIGWFFLLIFWGFNALMLYSCATGMAGVNEQTATMTESERAGAAIGTGLGLFMILGIWAAGALILGFAVMFTRGNKIIRTIEDGRK